MSSWDTSNVSYMGYMFYNATVFNQDIRNWDVSNVISFMGMFDQSPLMNAAPWNAPITPDASWFNQ